jgi:RHS repeat-associated protein
LAFKQNTTLRLNQTKGFDKLNRLTDITSTPQASGALPMAYSYQYNDANQRIQTRLADGSYWVYQYDEQGQVISGRRFWGDHTPVAGQQFDYAFDDIGNRQSTLAGGDQTGGNQRSSSYTADRLNRYSSRTVPATFDVLGLATATSAVSLELNDTTTYADAYRKGEYFRKELSDANTSAAKWSKVEVMVSGATTVTGNVFVPQTPEAYTYDNDGNLLTDGRWTYTWDAENRLVKQEAHAGVPAGARLKLEYEYDHQGRRIRKAVSTWSGSAWTLYQVRKFVYDGWNLIADLFDNDTLRVQFMWGTDVSGTAQGAGGVGGLVKIYDHASNKHYFPGYDGNGNVAVLVDGDSGAAGAVYEYGPFGELIRSSGVYAATNPFRFSTKYQDKETDLLYYGYRYYNPSTGRWLSRDPIEERGGRNVFAFVSNNAISQFDARGLYGESGHFYTTYIVAMAAKNDEKLAYELAYYSQLPDEYDTYNARGALNPLNNPWFAFGTGWAWNIQRELHSLHGSPAKDRRQCLKKMIMGKCGAPLKTWEKGFVIHAFADSYAHTDPETENLFSFPVGHANPFLEDNGHEYDRISLRPKLFMDYAYDLLDALGGSDRTKLDALAGVVSSLGATEPEERTVERFRQLAIDRYQYTRTYAPENKNYPEAINSGNLNYPDLLWMPTTKDVENLLKKIKCCCSAD